MYSKKQSKEFFNFLSCAKYKAVRFDEYIYFGDWRLHEVSDGEIHLPLLSLFHLLTDDRLKTIFIISVVLLMSENHFFVLKHSLDLF